jgi:predicted metal-binding transcription factor (methanogenesis marker protein 9)
MKSMALAKQTEFAFMKAAKGTDVPKPEVIELDEHIDAYKKKYGLTDEEVIEILRSFAPPKSKQNNEGGLQEQGGTKDPVSGNDVPIGSLKEEVRDDIPAMLSEGEFVFPADVVRYYGLDTLMKMRQKAKQGLKVMEAMGQMGNSEEATLPDDIPFDMDDLELAEGGVVEAQQGIYLPPDINTPTTGQQPGFGAAPTLFPVNQTATTPVMPVPEPVLPQPEPPKSFQDLIGGANFDETRPYINDAGDVRLIKFKNGEPIESIPEGFRPRGETDTVYQSPSLRGRASGSGQDSGSDTGRPAITAEEKANEDKLLRESAQRDLPPRGAESFNYDVKETGTVDEKGQPNLDVVPTGKFKDYLRARSPAGSFGIDYAGGFTDNKSETFKLDPTTGRLGKAGDFVDQGVVKAASVIPFASPLLRASDRDIRSVAAKRLANEEYANADEYNVLRNIIDLEPMKPGKFSLFKIEDDKKLKDNIAKAKKLRYSKTAANKFKKTQTRFAENLKKERAKNPFSRTGTPNQDQATLLNEIDVQRKGGYANMSGSEIEEQQRKNADNMRRAAAMDAQMERENRRRAEKETGGTSGSTFSESTVSGSGAESAGGSLTYCCTASYKQQAMTITEVKEIRRWHQRQSQVWQDGYDVWGKFIADKLVTNGKFHASVVKAVHDLTVKKKLTLKGLYGMMLISSGVYPIGLFKRIMRYGRIFQST